MTPCHSATRDKEYGSAVSVVGRGSPKSFVFWLLLFLTSLSVSFLSGEVILRLQGHRGVPQAKMSSIVPVDDAVVDWRHAPHSEYWEGRILYRYNARGFRDVDHKIAIPAGVRRIVVLGDSVAEGYGVEWESVFSSRIQSELGDATEVITIAQGGLNTPQEVHLLKKEGLQYRPDLVVLNFVLNDCDFYTRFEAAQTYTAQVNAKIGLLNVPIDPRLKRLLKSSALIYFLKERAEDLKGRILGLEQTDYFSRIWAEQTNRAKVRAGFDQLAVLQEEHRFDLLVIVWPLISDYQRYRFGPVHEWVRREAEKRGFATLDLLPGFSRLSYRKLQITSEDNVHPNTLGHSIAAESFLRWYRSQYVDSWTGREAGEMGPDGSGSISALALRPIMMVEVQEAKRNHFPQSQDSIRLVGGAGGVLSNFPSISAAGPIRWPSLVGQIASMAWEICLNPAQLPCR